MNERIKELVRECGGYAKDDDGGETKIAVLIGKDVEMFAELIVRECLGCCEQVISDPVPESVDTWLNGGEQCIQEIKEHFGVEE